MKGSTSFLYMSHILYIIRLAIFRYLRKYMTVLFIRDIIVDEEKIINRNIIPEEKRK